MKSFTKLSLIFITILLCACENYVEGKITKVIDGDSLFIYQNGKKVEVRLFGIDAPEFRQSFGPQAAEFLKKSALNKQTTINKISYDTHGRMLAIVDVDGQSLQSMLVENGYAWVYPRYCKKAICNEWEQLQEKAKQEKKGLWRKNNAVPPWQWRRR